MIISWVYLRPTCKVKSGFSASPVVKSQGWVTGGKQMLSGENNRCQLQLKTSKSTLKPKTFLLTYDPCDILPSDITTWMFHKYPKLYVFQTKLSSPRYPPFKFTLVMNGITLYPFSWSRNFSVILNSFISPLPHHLDSSKLLKVCIVASPVAQY